MKIYRVAFQERDLGCLLSWHSSRAAAKAALRRLRSEHGERAIGPDFIDPVEIPTDKPGLLRWLNFSVTTDNG